MPQAATIESRILELREEINATTETIGERMTQYSSECALFGDAGPGMHPSCWRGDLEARLAPAEAELARLLATPEGRALQEREESEFMDWLHSQESETGSLTSDTCPF